MMVRRTRLLPVIILGCILAAVLLASVASGASETTGDVSGRVIDKNSGEGISDVEIVITSLESETREWATSTDNDGKYTVLYILPGDYLINATYKGEHTTQEVTVVANEMTIAADLYFIIDGEDVAPVEDDDAGFDDDDDAGFDDNVDAPSADEESKDGGSLGVPIASGLLCAVAIGFILITMVVVVVIVIIAYNYSKISSTKLMNHDTRVKIYDHIDKNPGNHLRKIKRDLTLPMGVLTHHISMMEREEVIKSRLDGQYRRYYPWNFKIEKKEWLSDMQNHIVKTVQENPGISPNKVAKALKISRNNAYYHTGELEAKGIIWIDRSGKSHKCFMKIDT